MDWKRVNNDIYGNPRYVCHFSELETPADDELGTMARYDAAVARAKTVGGRRYRGRDFGGGIVFTSYNLKETEAAIAKVVAGEVRA